MEKGLSNTVINNEHYLSSIPRPGRPPDRHHPPRDGCRPRRSGLGRDLRLRRQARGQQSHYPGLGPRLQNMGVH